MALRTVAVALDLEGDAGADVGAQRLPRVPGQLHVDGAVRQARQAEPLRDLVAQRRAHCAVDLRHKHMPSTLNNQHTVKLIVCLHKQSRFKSAHMDIRTFPSLLLALCICQN